jgi:hypothetical protein
MRDFPGMVGSRELCSAARIVERIVLLTTNSAPEPGVGSALQGEMPETDDPAVLRELLHQAREEIRLHRSFDQLIAENAARADALLAETSRKREHARNVGAAEMREVVSAVRQGLNAALAGIDQLEKLLAPQQEVAAHAVGKTPFAETEASEDTSQSHRIDVLMHPVTAPSLARSAQQHLAAVDGVERAEVRELAEGLLRITVESRVPITQETFAQWEPERVRSVKNANAEVIEISLDG